MLDNTGSMDDIANELLVRQRAGVYITLFSEHLPDDSFTTDDSGTSFVVLSSNTLLAFTESVISTEHYRLTLMDNEEEKK